MRGLALCSCGPTGRVTKSATLLKQMVEYNIFDFVFCFSGVSTIDSMVVPALSRFLENVFVYDMKPWEALERSFGEDRHALEASPVVLCFSGRRYTGDSYERVVESRMLAYSSFADSRPWGLDMFCCENCGGPSQNIKFNACGRKSYGNKWLQTKMKYYCRQCKVSKQAIPAPDWVNSCRSDNMYRVWYNWPLTNEQLASIGVRY
ncbi:hypothetical protein DEU56DRAFT_746634 [Suillus clintonianus]|uniref:uncharacterized protein n=1 Tax=Suillus clintonianus TaxID=1904413 RepID=UPI001B86D3CD|nr:uncharacterized protein DEU56DRAFT_746634 [Suillus clintonianus]KAG2121473.1 hypothetical protein DEU56DRAFT_746634 [Suillus clintonianus]